MHDQNLDPDAASALNAANASGLPPWNTMPVSDARIAYVNSCKVGVGDTIDVNSVEDLSMSLSERTIKGRMYRPQKNKEHDGAQNLIIHFHGGGFVLGDLDSHDNMCRRLCRDSGAIVLAVDYRLAPEHPFPAAIDDAFESVLWARDNAETLGFEPSQIILSGDSAGANLALVSAIKMRDSNIDPATSIVLMYPVADTDLYTESYEKCANGYRLTRQLMTWFLNHYLPDGRMWKNPLAAPLKTKDLSGLPSALVITAGFDPLADEGISLVNRLNDAGNMVKHIHAKGMIHGFCNMFSIMKEGAKTMDEVTGWIRANIG